MTDPHARFAELLKEWGSAASLAREFGVSSRTIRNKRGGVSPVLPMDVLALERALQIRGERIDALVSPSPTGREGA